MTDERELSKGEKLIWELFELVREFAVPVTATNTERLNKWAAAFRDMHGPSHPPPLETGAPETEHRTAKRK
jgi:hypothetical protein